MEREQPTYATGTKGALTSFVSPTVSLPGVTADDRMFSGLSAKDFRIWQDTATLLDRTPIQMAAHNNPQPIMVNTMRRIVQVFVSDTNPNVPLEDCVLYHGKEHLTDLNDQELFFEIELKEILKKHNVKRVKMTDKSIKDRTQYLEPARIRDLKTTVVTIANL